VSEHRNHEVCFVRVPLTVHRIFYYCLLRAVKPKPVCIQPVTSVTSHAVLHIAHIQVFLPEWKFQDRVIRFCKTSSHCWKWWKL